MVESNNKIRQSYEAMITSPEERALYDEWAKTWDDYKKGTAGGHGAVAQGGRQGPA